ncbi:hypothetical protein GSU75_05835 [Pseudomonas savastanoi pv. phaseolicola]|nr:hypothetical protein [Pseudomonas savastanoi pv. phaseolicola]
MLQQFEGVARLHGTTVTGAPKALAPQLKRFNAQAQQRFTFIVGAMGVLAGKVVHLEVLDITLLVQAVHGDRQPVVWLTIVERLNRYFP